jgi:diaminopimelate epimerase
LSSFPFAKMEATGNDFVVVYAHDLPDDQGPESAAAICDRRTGIGADGVLIVGQGRSLTDADRAVGASAAMTLWNADGSLAQMCGNGLRCIALLLLEHGHWSGEDATVINTAAGPVSARIVSQTQAVPRQIELDLGGPRAADLEPLQLHAGGKSLLGRRVDMGNPHFVLFRDEQRAPLPDLSEWAAELETLATFPERTNVEWAIVEAPNRIRLRVWERGVGETQACGSGACATVVAARLSGRVGDGPCQVILPGGVLQVSWAGGMADPVRLCGNCTLSHTGTWTE